MKVTRTAVIGVIAVIAVIGVLLACVERVPTQPAAGGDQRTEAAPLAAAADGQLVFGEDFESGSLGAWQDGVDATRHRVLTDASAAHSGMRVLEMTYAAGQGGGWLTRFFLPGYDSLYVSYWIRLQPTWTGSTALVDLRGSRMDNQWSSFGKGGVCPTGADFFTTGVSIGRLGGAQDLSFATYYPGMPREADGVSCAARAAGPGATTTYAASRALTPGVWHRVEVWVTLNTVGQSNAVQRVWLDGALVGEWRGLTLRTDGQLRLNAFLLDGTAVAPQTERLYIDDVEVRTAAPAPPPPAPAPVAAVTVAVAASSLPIGQTTQAVATLRDTAGTVLTDRAISWTSANPQIATVSTTGLVTAVAAGTATITATSEGVSGSATVTVVAAPPPNNALFSEGFESGTLSAWQDGVDATKQRVLTDASLAHSGARVLEMTYPAGQGGGWLTRFFLPGYDSLYVSYWVRLQPTWTAATALFGLRGSRTDNQWSAFGKAGVCPNGTDFFAATVETGSSSNALDLAFDTYYPGMPREPDGVTCWGRTPSAAPTYAAARRLTAGVWHRVELWVKLNTVGQNDGIEQLWLDGALIGEWNGLVFRTSTLLRVNSLMLDGAAQAPQTQRLYVDDIELRTANPRGSTPPPPPPPAPVASVTVVLGSSSLAVGHSTQATATLRDANGNVLTGRTVTWSTSNSSVATVNASGTVTAVAAGSAAIPAASEGIIGSATVTVSPPPVASVTVTLNSASLTVGQTTQAGATLRDASGNTLTGRSISWSSAAPSVATVSSSGTVTAVAAGTAAIRATSEGVTGSATVTVSAAPPSTRVDTIFSETFESGTLSAWDDGVDPSRHRVVTDATLAHAGTRALEVSYPANDTGGWLTRFFMPGYDSVYVRLFVRLAPDWVGGSKLLLLRGSRTDNQWSAFGVAGQCPGGTDFFATNIMLQDNGNPGTLTFYTYFPEMAREPDGVTCWGRFGDGQHEQYYPPLTLARGSWQQLEFWVKLNTPAQHDGGQRMWVNGVLRGEWGSLMYRTSSILRLNSMSLELSSPTASVPRKLWIDDILVTTARPTP